MGTPGSLARENSTGEGTRQDYETTTLVVAENINHGGYRVTDTTGPLLTGGRGVHEANLAVDSPSTFMASDYATGTFEECETARPLTTSADRSRAAPIVAFDARGNGGQEVTPTVTGDHNNRVTDYTILRVVRDPETAIAYRTAGNDGPFESRDVVHCLNTATDPSQNIIAFTQNGSDEVRVIGGDGEQAACLNTSSTTKHRTFLAFTCKDSGADAALEVSPTLRAMNFDKSHLNGGGQVAVATPSLVRRLTPLECELLQGFPPGWTEGFADSTRYRMMGNAVCVKVSRWIAARLWKVMTR